MGPPAHPLVVGTVFHQQLEHVNDLNDHAPLHVDDFDVDDRSIVVLRLPDSQIEKATAHAKPPAPFEPLSV